MPHSLVVSSRASVFKTVLVLQELEESYEKFQSRINQMELDVYPTTRSLDSQHPTQSLHRSTSFD